MPLRKKTSPYSNNDFTDPVEKKLLPQFSFEQRPKSAPILPCLDAILRSPSIISKRFEPVQEQACIYGSLEAGEVVAGEGDDNDLVSQTILTCNSVSTLG